MLGRYCFTATRVTRDLSPRNHQQRQAQGYLTLDGMKNGCQKACTLHIVVLSAPNGIQNET